MALRAMPPPVAARGRCRPSDGPGSLAPMPTRTPWARGVRGAPRGYGKLLTAGPRPARGVC